MFHHELTGFWFEHNRKPLLSKPFTKFLQLYVKDLRNLLLIQGIEHDDVINPVQQFRRHNPLELFHCTRLYVFIRQDTFARCREAKPALTRYLPCPGITRHDDDRVPEAHRMAQVVAQLAFLEHLQEQVKDVGMRLLNLVQQDNRVRTLPNLLGQRTALIIADITGRSSHKAGGCMLFHEIAHINTD